MDDTRGQQARGEARGAGRFLALEKALIVSAILLALALLATIAAALSGAAAIAPLFQSSNNQQYKPPPFELSAVAGMPAPPEGFGYSEIDAMGSFTFGLAGVIYQQEDGSLRIYFANPEKNEAYMMCEVVGPDGNTLYKSGLLRPGEYVASLNPVIKLENKAVNVEVKVYALDPEQFYSIGTVTLDNVLQAY
jgi:acylphosphatase